MKIFPRILVGILLLGCLPLSAVSIKTAYTRYYAESDIRPISQYFGSDISEQGFRSVVASQPADPTGQYFILRLEDWKSASLSSVRMTLFSTDSKESSTRTWTLDGKKLENWLYLGLTGADWKTDEVRPLAWRIELLDGSGQAVAEWKSFLWEMPE